MKKVFTLLLVLTLVFTTLVGCKKEDGTDKPGTTSDNKGIAKEDLLIGFLYVGPIGDQGYSYAHDLGRLDLEAAGYKTKYVENVPETADCEKSIRDLIDQGCNVIIATSFGHMDWTYNVSLEYPDVKFFHCSGYQTGDNMSAFFGRMYQIRFLSGIAAGLKTETNKIGYVAAMPLAEVVRGANAFALGVQSVNPDATVEVKWTNSWYDPAAEKAAAVELLNSGADVLAQHCDTTGPQIAAEEKGAFAVGYNANTFDVAPGAFLTAPLWNWGVYYLAQMQQIVDGTWEASNYWGSMDTGIVSLADLTNNCAPGTKEAIEAAYNAIAAGEYDVFDGPLTNNEGIEMVPEGSTMSDADLLAMVWFVDGIIGSVPKSN
ncbi:MAG: Purine-binding protein [Clostridiales bacterium]|jgi:basic membrane protein A|nr:Purine-binding protein [Clostridiales bacterium]